MITPRSSFGFICDTVDLHATQRRPSPEEQVVIDSYRETYEKAVGHIAHGLHYIPLPGKKDTVAVWLPLPSLSSPGAEPY